jgi:endonuclease YncB( thermonuclease family)
MGCINTKTNLNSNENPMILDITNNEILKFNLSNIKGNFYVKSVYDGDTIVLLVPIRMSVYSFISKDKIDNNSSSNPDSAINLFEIRTRLMGIDTPELKPLKNIPNREEHINKAAKAKNFLLNLIENKLVKVEFSTNDKYGRPLCTIYYNNQNINILMIEKGLAKKYDGGTKD